MSMDRTYCSSDEILTMCSSCIRNDKQRIKAVNSSDRNSVSMTKARPHTMGGKEYCGMYITRVDMSKGEL